MGTGQRHPPITAYLGVGSSGLFPSNVMGAVREVGVRVFPSNWGKLKEVPIRVVPHNVMRDGLVIGGGLGVGFTRIAPPLMPHALRFLSTPMQGQVRSITPTTWTWGSSQRQPTLSC